MKLTQLTESFVINNDEFEDYLNRGTEQLKTELEGGKNARDAVHDLALTFSQQHNKSYEAYERMSDSLAARMHTLELGNDQAPAMDMPDEIPSMDPEAPSDMDMAPDMAPEEPADSEMGGMDMNVPDAEEMPNDEEMADYDAVMANKPDAEESMEESVGSLTQDDYDAKRKELQDIQLDPETSKDPELKAELMRRLASLKAEAKASGIKEGTMIGGLMKYDGQPEEEYAEAVSKYNEFMDEPREANDETTDMVMSFVFDDELLDDMAEAQEQGNKDVRDIVAKRMAELGHANESVSEAEERPYICFHAKKGKHECHADSSYGAAKKAAAHWKLKSTAGITPKLADVVHVGEESAMIEEGAMDTLKKIVADKQNMPVKFDDGQMKVDLFTASAVTQVYDKVNDANREKIDNMLKTKAGMLKIADFAMSSLKEGKLGRLAKAGVGMAAKAGMDKKTAIKTARGIEKGVAVGKAVKNSPITKTIGKGIGNVAKAAAVGMQNKLSGVSGGAIPTSKKKVFNADDVADRIVNNSARIAMSEYNEFYKELDKAAKQGKKAGDTISVGGKKIKLKSAPKPMDQLTDSDFAKIDALAQKIDELAPAAAMAARAVAKPVIKAVAKKSVPGRFVSAVLGK
tara:strand:- start:2274 stop:4163 length:1890 start_codon:yes stop_codon:yes gene_type:complete